MPKPSQPDVTYTKELISAVYKSVQKTPWTGSARVTPSRKLIKKEVWLKTQVTWKERNKLCDKMYPALLGWPQADLFANFCGMEGKNVDEFLRIMVENGYIKSTDFNSANIDQRQLMAHHHMTAIIALLVQPSRDLLATLTPDQKQAFDIGGIPELDAESDADEEFQSDEGKPDHGSRARKRLPDWERDEETYEI
ncbi:hypothetical protein LX32DRAFT_657985 [Colletotrichum zoysiae]|uniref:Uncharacterized protein n=1 Tax=Colletotrichum zoysiae TaxID=1216348 RepID=A0AAD9LUY6_9PEZI|nr:hypothetical protein LX32DRAFT_657985 [Colletotrichum zoysiae]